MPVIFMLISKWFIVRMGPYAKVLIIFLFTVQPHDIYTTFEVKMLQRFEMCFKELRKIIVLNRHNIMEN